MAATAAFAQINPQPTMVSALRWVGSQPIIYVQLQGQKVIDGQLTEVDYEGYISRFQINSDGTPDTSIYKPQVDIEAFVQNGKSYVPLFRIIGDGNYLYRYAYPDQTAFTAQRANSYLDIPYGRQQDPMQAMLSGLSRLTDSYSDFIGTLFRQAFNSSSIEFNPWIGSAKLNDASSLTALTYQNPTAMINYYPSYVTPTDIELPSVTYTSIQDILGTKQVQSWSMSIWSLPTVTGAKFNFVPPAGALPISSKLPFGR